MQTKRIWIKCISYKNVLYGLFPITHTYLRQNLYSKDTMRWKFLICMIKKQEYLCINTIITCFHTHSMDFSLSISQTTVTILETRVITSFMFRMRTILNTGPTIWNSLPKNVKCSKSTSQFNRNFVSFYNSSSTRKSNILIYKIL